MEKFANFMGAFARVVRYTVTGGIGILGAAPSSRALQAPVSLATAMHRKLGPKYVAILTALVSVYFLAGKLGLKLAYLNASTSPVWPCTGIAIAAVLILGYRIWPGIFVGAFLVNVTTAGTVSTSLAIATGNTLEGLVAAYLMVRYADGRNVFQRSHNIFKFALFAAFGATISATVGTTILTVGGLASWAAYSPLWSTWWLGDVVGAIIVAPLLLLWVENPRLEWTRKQILELVFLFGGLFAVSWGVFGNGLNFVIHNYPFEYLCFPFLVWAAFRFGRRKAATASAALAVVATWGTYHGYGPFARSSENTSLLLLQSFMAIAALTALVLAAESTEHRRAEEHVRHLADSDALTGLANYRRLVDALDSEIKRYNRSRIPFAILLLDMDHLKQINDTHGHLVGSRALCRLADILRLNCREIDVAARYGGDEFVLVLPEASGNAALHVAQRISDRLRNDGLEPPLSVSIGVANYPADGTTLEELLSAADRALYANKHTATTGP
jgi:diguanylate cyclase (GGDEF)-like protein